MNWVSLFSNVWISDFYLNNFWIDIKVANELIPKRADLYSRFYPNSNMICWDITDENIYNKVLKSAIDKKCKFLIATPPCQWMSFAWKRQQDDPRNNLVVKAVNFIKDLKPDYVILENVPSFFKTKLIIDWKEIIISDYLDKELSKIYNINKSILDAWDYWTAQIRKRAIAILTKKPIPLWDFPKKQKQITVQEAIWYLPSLESWEKSHIPYHFAKKHNDKHILWMRHTPTWKTAFDNKIYYPQKENWETIKWYRTTYKRINWDKPAPTITMCNWWVSSQNNVHPWRKKSDWTYSDARVLSLKEIFILTWLPDNISFPNWASENLIRQVIWEWVPPKLISSLLWTMPNYKNHIKWFKENKFKERELFTVA